MKTETYEAMHYEQKTINSNEERYKQRFNHQRDVYIATNIELKQSETSEEAFRLLGIRNRAEFLAYEIMQQMWQIGMDINEVFKQSK